MLKADSDIRGLVTSGAFSVRTTVRKFSTVIIRYFWPIWLEQIFLADLADFGDFGLKTEIKDELK